MQDLIAEYQQYQEAGVDDLEEEYGEEQYAEDGQEVSFSCPVLPSRFAYSPPDDFAVRRGVNALDVRAGPGIDGKQVAASARTRETRKSKKATCGSVDCPFLVGFLLALPVPPLSTSASSSSTSSSFRPAPVSRYAVKSSLRGFFLLLFSPLLFVLSDTSLSLLQCLSPCGHHSDVLLWI